MLYPTSATREEHLLHLLSMQKCQASRLAVHLLLKEWDEHPPTNALMCFLHDGTPLLRIGPTPNFGCLPADVCHVNLVFVSDPRLADAFRQWFDFAWLHGKPLTDETACVPHLVRPPGTREATAMWEHYKALFRGKSLVEDASRRIAVDPDTGEVTAVSPTGTAVESPSEALGLPKHDPLAHAIMSLIARGRLVSVDKSTRAKPLDAPLHPRLFGLSQEQQHGKVSRVLTFRCSIFDEADLKQLETYRKKISHLLEKFCVSLGDGVRWMPDAAYESFEEMRIIANTEGLNCFKAIIGGDAKQFIESQRERLYADANSAYQEFRPNQTLSRSQFEHIIAALRGRLTAVSSGRLMPEVSRMHVTLDLTGVADEDAKWGQALSFLYDLAAKQREAISSPFFWRGFDPKPRSLYLEVMDVAADTIGRTGSMMAAGEELIQLREIRDDEDLSARAKCEQIQRLIRGRR